MLWGNWKTLFYERAVNHNIFRKIGNEIHTKQNSANESEEENLIGALFGGALKWNGKVFFYAGRNEPGMGGGLTCHPHRDQRKIDLS